jgi:hypothetical protein
MGKYTRTIIIIKVRTKLIISLFITILGLTAFLEIMEYKYRSTQKSLYESRVLESELLGNDIKKNLKVDTKYKVLNNNLDLKFTQSENKEEWLRELHYIEKKDIIK